ncbi:Mrp/NBP35 family ATP-binding protein [Alicyclobacillus curvatus]|jgi:ATP-binding protein involved in chromosome partitioning|nr:Mrp/NBP35 family ATP-binding protein [Alicyclobacillus curvatus]
MNLAKEATTVVTKEQVLEALWDVEDPEVHKSIVELEMVKDITIEGSSVSVKVLLTISGCPLRTVIEKSVSDKLLELPGIEKAYVEIGTMSDEERAKFAGKLRGKSESQSTPAILQPDAGVEFLAIASGKGGVGKSTVTANLAKALANEGLRVGVIDADIYGFSIPAIFGVKDARPTVIDELIIPIEVDNVKLISMHFFVPNNNPVVWRGPMLGKMLRNFFAEVHWGDVDVVLLDLPPGTGDIAMDVHQLLPKSKELIVTTPQANAADVAVRAGVMGLRTNHEIVGVVENMAYFQCPGCGEKTYLFGRGGGEEVANALKAPLLAQVPIASMDSLARGIFEVDSPQGQAFKDLAKTIIPALGLAVRV